MLLLLIKNLWAKFYLRFPYGIHGVNSVKSHKLFGGLMSECAPAPALSLSLYLSQYSAEMVKTNMYTLSSLSATYFCFTRHCLLVAGIL